MSRLLSSALLAAIVVTSGAWGPRGHTIANLAAVDAMPADGPTFLKEFRDWIGQTGPLPDAWRGISEPYSKIFEDPNHGWFKEQFSFMTSIPRNRYEFVLRLYDEYLRIKDTDPERASLTNIRWTGTMPYAAAENYDRMKSAMRGWISARMPMGRRGAAARPPRGSGRRAVPPLVEEPFDAGPSTSSVPRSGRTG